MKAMKIRLTNLTPILGTWPADPEIASKYIASLAPNAETAKEEVERIGAAEYEAKQMTVFFRNLDTMNPVIPEHMIRGFFKAACEAMRRSSDPVKSKKVSAYKKVITQTFIIAEHYIEFEDVSNDEIQINQRPLRASTPQGDITALSSAEEIPAGKHLTFTLYLLDENQEDLARELLDYGIFSGLGQWRNAGYGKFIWECLSVESGLDISIAREAIIRNLTGDSTSDSEEESSKN